VSQQLSLTGQQHGLQQQREQAEVEQVEQADQAQIAVQPLCQRLAVPISAVSVVSAKNQLIRFLYA
jgi:hypothetical protein